jgi:hypothetical protein
MRAPDGRSHMTATLGVLGLAAIIGYGVLSLALGGGFAIPVGLVGAGATALALRGPLGQAIARRLDGSEPPSGAASRSSRSGSIFPSACWRSNPACPSDSTETRYILAVARHIRRQGGRRSDADA